MPRTAHSSPVEAVAGIIWREGRLLAAQRPQGKAMAGYWEFPGGKMEKGESMEDALTRELREELGIAAKTVSHWKSLAHEYPHGSVLLHFLHVTSFTGDVQALEGQGLQWAYPHEALAMNFLPPDRPLLQELAEKQSAGKTE